MKWSIGTKIGGGFTLALVMLVIIGMASYRSATGFLEAAELRSHTYVVLGELRNLLSALQDAETGQRGYLLTGQESYLEPYNAAVGTAGQFIDELRRLTADNPNQQHRLDALQPLVTDKMSELRLTIDLRRNKGFEAALEAVQSGKGKQAMDDIRRLITQMEKDEDDLLKARDERLNADAQKMISIITFGIPAAFVLLAVAGLWITRDIVVPLKAITAASVRIAAGDLPQEFTSGGRQDEVGVLARAFAAMTRSLREMAGVAGQIAAGNLRAQVKPQSERDVLGNAFATMVAKLRRTISELTEGVGVLGSAAGEIVATTAQVASGAAETATAVTETTTTVEEVKKTAQLSSEKALYVSDTAQKAAQVSQGGRRAVEQSIEGINAVRRQMEAIAQSIVKLSEQGQAIGEIIATVNDLAEQSNLLAVNAAIEASKAGEQGKGFTVVAQEIKSLAEQSKQATMQVRGILGDIQKATTAAVLAAEQGSKAVEAGVKQSTESGEAIRALSQSIVEAAQAASQIAASSHQQQVGMDQVALAMDNIRQASAQNAAGTKQAEAAAHNLNELGRRLRDVVDQYRL